ncbi:MAG: hypothetical protein KAQ91_01015, partial [Methylococcales bacterium]|nr:hypothetical protein [Methylococcales bacterium]
VLSACSTQLPKPISNTDSTKIHSTSTDAVVTLDKALPAPDLTIIKNGKTLKLTRIMEGGACKNNQQGALGLFRLYTNPDDIERIKQNQGSGVFADFELLIEAFSMRALQKTVDQFDFQPDLFAISESDVQKELADKFTRMFISLIADDIAEFEIKTTLMIDVSPLPNALTIYLNGCETAHDH